jgi:lipoate-protein ligase A
MAIDEALLGVISRPVLRVYRWARPAVSFGYFEQWAPIRDAHPERELVRRWTGGGVVPHGEDFTYSLLIPRGADIPAAGPAESYAMIHGALCRTLSGSGIEAFAAPASMPKLSQACFENPVMHDVLVNGGKVAGAAQRRTRMGLIHQGSVQRLALPGDFADNLARALSREVSRESYDVTVAAEDLVAGKYGTRVWLERW